MGDDAKKVILSRRARFIAAAMATTAMGAVPACGESQVCLEMAVVPDASSDRDDGGDGGPQVCLSVVRDAGPDAVDATDEDAAPQPCLSPLPGDSSSG